MAIPNPNPGTYHIAVTGTGSYAVGVIAIDAAGSSSQAQATSPAQNQTAGPITPGEIQQFTYATDSHNLQREPSSPAALSGLATARSTPGPVSGSVTPNLFAGWKTDNLVGFVSSGVPQPAAANPQSSLQRSWEAGDHHVKNRALPSWTRWALFLIITIVLLLVIIVVLDW